MKRVVPVLQRKGLTIVGFNDWYGGVYLPYAPTPYLTDGHPDEIDLKEARAWGEEIGQRALKIASGDISQIPRLPREEEDSLFRCAPNKESAVSDLRRTIQRNMRINMERCKYPMCTICIDNCPMDAIDFSVSPSVFKSFCHADFFCEAICPEGAIEADFVTLSAEHDKIVQGEHSRFVNDAEEKDRFRRLLPLEKLNWSRHKYETDRRPRLKPS